MTTKRALTKHASVAAPRPAAFVVPAIQAAAQAAV